VIFFHDTARSKWNLEFMAAGNRAAGRKTLVDSREFRARARSIVYRAESSFSEEKGCETEEVSSNRDADSRGI